MKQPEITRRYEAEVHGQRVTVTRYATTPTETTARAVGRNRRAALRVAESVWEATEAELTGRTDYDRLREQPAEGGLVEWWLGAKYDGEDT